MLVLSGKGILNKGDGFMAGHNGKQRALAHLRLLLLLKMAHGLKVYSSISLI